MVCWVLLADTIEGLKLNDPVLPNPGTPGLLLKLK